MGSAYCVREPLVLYTLPPHTPILIMLRLRERMWLIPVHATHGKQNQDLTPKALVGSPNSPLEGLERQATLLRLCAAVPLTLTFLVQHRCPQYINQLLPTEVLWLQQPWEGLVLQGPRPFAGASGLLLMPGKDEVSNRGIIHFQRCCPFLLPHTSSQILTNASESLG